MHPNKFQNTYQDADSSKVKIFVSIFTLMLICFAIAHRERMNQNTSIQKEWIKEQKREHQWNNDNENRENSEYAEQTDNLTRMRGMLEDEMTMKKKQQLKELQQF